MWASRVLATRSLSTGYSQLEPGYVGRSSKGVSSQHITPPRYPNDPHEPYRNRSRPTDPAPRRSEQRPLQPDKLTKPTAASDLNRTELPVLNWRPGRTEVVFRAEIRVGLEILSTKTLRIADLTAA